MIQEGRCAEGQHLGLISSTGKGGLRGETRRTSGAGKKKGTGAPKGGSKTLTPKEPLIFGEKISGSLICGGGKGILPVNRREEKGWGIAVKRGL